MATATPPMAKTQNKRGLLLGDGGWDYNRGANFNFRSAGLGYKSAGLSLYSNFDSGYADSFDYYPLGSKITGVTINKEVHVPVPVPHPVPYEVTRYVAVPQPVPYKVDRPYPVPVPHPVPVEVTRHVPIKVDRPYPVPVPYEVKVPHAVPVPVGVDYSVIDAYSNLKSNYGYGAGVPTKKW